MQRTSPPQTQTPFCSPSPHRRALTSMVSPSTATTRLMYTLSSARKPSGPVSGEISLGGWKMITSPGTGSLQRQ